MIMVVVDQFSLEALQATIKPSSWALPIKRLDRLDWHRRKKRERRHHIVVLALDRKSIDGLIVQLAHAVKLEHRALGFRIVDGLRVRRRSPFSRLLRPQL